MSFAPRRPKLTVAAALRRRPGLRLLAGSLRGSRRPLLSVAGWSVVEAGPALASGWVLAAALDRGFLPGNPGRGLAWLSLLAVLYVARALAGRAMFDPLSRIVEPMRDTLVRRVVRVTLHQAVHRTRPVDAVGVARLTSQVDSVRGIVGALLRTARPLTVTLLAALVGLAVLDPMLAGIVVVPLAAAMVWFLLAMRALTRRRRAAVLAEEDVAEATGAVLAAATDIAAIGAEDFAGASVERAGRASVRAMTSVARANALRVPIVLLGAHVPLLVLLLVGPALVSRGAVAPGAVVGAVMYLSAHLVSALRTMTSAVTGQWCQLQVVLERLAATTAVSAPPVAGTAPPPERYDLLVHGLSFAYGPHADPVLRDVDLAVPEGDHLVVVGASGIGKSTLAGLLAGLEPPLAGSVRVGGRHVTELAEEARTSTVALLPQEAYVFPGTVRENLRYLAPDSSAAQLATAVAEVGLSTLVERLGGCDAYLDDPVGTLSSGERQLLAAARVYLSTARVVILDEATCHLDMASEAVVERAFAARPGTVIVIAHRLASAVRARRVLLLDGGRAVCGTHAELLAKEPGYAALVGHWDAATPSVSPVTVRLPEPIDSA